MIKTIFYINLKYINLTKLELNMIYQTLNFDVKILAWI